MPTINEKTKNLYIAINNVVSEIGKEGQIDSRHKLTEELMHALFYIDGGEYKPELLDTPDAALTKDAEPATTCPRIELVVAIHSLASDFENMSYSFGADTEDRKRAQGSIKHAMAVANKHNQNGAGCITRPTVPKAITADMVTDEVADLVETTTTGAGAWDMVKPKELIAAAVNAFNGVKP